MGTAGDFHDGITGRPGNQTLTFMDAIEFPQQTFILAKDQPEYIPLPVHVRYYQDEEGNLLHRGDNNPIPQEMTCCFKLTPEEIEEINRTGQLWHTQCVQGDLFHPIRMTTKNPFE